MIQPVRHIVCAGLVLAAISAQGFNRNVDLLSPIAADGVLGFRFGRTAEAMLGKPFSPSLDPGPHGEQLIRKDIREPRFGFDSLHLGFTMESQRLCSLSLVRNFSYSEGDAAVLGMASNVCTWLVASFGAAMKQNAGFDLRSPPHALYASLETDALELKLEASRRPDVPMAWLSLRMLDRRLAEEASAEYARLSCDEAVKSEVEGRKRRLLWFAPLLYAMLPYGVCCLPVFLLLLVAYLVVMKVRRRGLIRAFGWFDPLALVLSPYVWACLEGVGQPKSLANIVEFAIIGWMWCLCLAVRYTLSAMGCRRFERFYGPATLLLVFSVAALLAAFFPTLPE